jgi:signal transduction histidine kinase
MPPPRESPRIQPGHFLLLVAVPVILLLTSAAGVLATRSYGDARDAARHDTELVTDSAAEVAQRFFDSRTQLLQTIASGPAVTSGDPAVMTSEFADLPALTGFNSVFWVDRSGRARASSVSDPAALSIDLSDRLYVREVMETGQPYIGTGIVGRLLGTLVIPVAVPTRGPDGAPSGVLTGMVALGSSGTSADQLRFGNEAWLRMVDADGQLVVSSSAIEELRSVRDWPNYQRARAQQAGILDGVTGLAGDEDRVVGFRTVQAGNLLVLIERPSSQLYGAAVDRLRLELTTVLAFGAASLLGAGWAARRLQAQARREQSALESEHSLRSVAEEALRRRDEFVAVVVHDLRTPLTVIRGFSQLLSGGRARPEAQQQSLIEIERATRSITRMVDQLIDVQRLGERPLELHREPVDLVELVEVTIGEYQQVARRHEIEFVAAESRLVGDWDEQRIERAIYNLISNAVKYSTPGSRVLVRARRETPEPWTGRRPDEDDGASTEHDVAILEVQDFGIGIPASEVGSLFERFKRASNVGSVPGSGLGLAGVRQVVEEHGGSVSVDSTEGVGTTFTVRLPMFGPDETEGAPDEVAAEPDAVATEG